MKCQSLVITYIQKACCEVPDLFFINIGMNSDNNTLLGVLFYVYSLLIKKMIDFWASHPMNLDYYLRHVGFPISDFTDLKVSNTRIFHQKVLEYLSKSVTLPQYLLPFLNPSADIPLNVEQQVGTWTSSVYHDEDVLDLFRINAGMFANVYKGGGGQTS